MTSEMARFVVLIPARSGSKGIVDKNLRRVSGISLVGRALKYALENFRDAPIVVSSDSRRVFNRALSDNGLQLGVSSLEVGSLSRVGRHLYLHSRSPGKSDDNAPIGPLVREVWTAISEMGSIPRAVALLQPTSPFRSREDARMARNLISQLGPTDSAVSVVRVYDAHPARMYRLHTGQDRLERLAGFDLNELTPRQKLPTCFLRDGGFYLIGSELAAQGLQIGTAPYFMERKYPWTLNIDTWEDLETARRVARRMTDD